MFRLTEILDGSTPDWSLQSVRRQKVFMIESFIQIVLLMMSSVLKSWDSNCLQKQLRKMYLLILSCLLTIILAWDQDIHEIARDQKIKIYCNDQNEKIYGEL